MVSIGSTEMKKVIFVAAAAGLMSLAACTPAANNTADANTTVEANAGEYDAAAANDVDANAVVDMNAAAPTDANEAAPANAM